MKVGFIQEAMDEVMEMQIAPLIDCVFQLLIYFMVSASLHKTEADLGIQLPGSVAQVQAAKMPDETIIEIDNKGQVLLNNKVYDSAGARELPQLTAMLVRYKQAAVLAKNKALVTISPGEEVVQQRVVDVMNACAEAGIKDVTFQ